MTWVPHITVSPIAPPPDLFDLTAATGHPLDGLSLLLPSGGDYLYFLYGSDIRGKYSGQHKITSQLFNDGGGALPTEFNADAWLVTSRDTAGSEQPDSVGPGSMQKACQLHLGDTTTINCGRRITAPASRSNATLNFFIRNFGGDMRARFALSDGSATAPIYVLPRNPNGVDACFSVDFASATSAILTVDVYCAARVQNVYEETTWKAVWMPPPVPPPFARGWQVLQMLTGVMGDGRGSL